MPRFRLGVVSTFPPREDGIATFTRDLLDAVCAAGSGITARIAAARLYPGVPTLGPGETGRGGST